MEWLLLAIGAVLTLAMILISKASRRLPVVELRRRARRGRDAGLYRLASGGRTAALLAGLLGVIGFVILASDFNDWWQLGLLALVVYGLLIWTGPRVDGQLWHLSSTLANWLVKVLNRLPLTATVEEPEPHTQLYEKDDLVDFLTAQLHQPDSRISAGEVRAAIAVLNFGAKKVSDAMTPLAKATLPAEAEDIGPHLLDQLHKSAADCFIVVKDSSHSAKPTPVGTLYLDEALAHASGGKVKDAMRGHVEWVDEDEPLITALQIFLDKKCHLLAVQNGFNEMVGVLSLNAVLEQIFGPRKTNAAEDAKITPNDKSSS